MSAPVSAWSLPSWMPVVVLESVSRKMVELAQRVLHSPKGALSKRRRMAKSLPWGAMSASVMTGRSSSPGEA